MEFFLKTRASSSAPQYVASSQRSSPQAISHGFPSVHPVVASISLLPRGALHMLFPTVSPPSTLSSLPSRSFATELSSSYFPHLPLRSPCRRFSIAPSLRRSPRAIFHGFSSVHPVVASVAPSQSELFPSYFPRIPFRPPCHCFHPAPSQSHTYPQFPLRPPCRRFHLAPSQRSYPQLSIIKLFPTVFPPSTLSSLPSRSFPTRLSPSYFQRFPSRPPCRRFIIAPSQRSSPQAISQGFLSVHLVVASISLLCHRTLFKLFPTASPPFTLSSLPSRSFPT